MKTATVECKVGYNCTIECKVGIRNIITPFTVRFVSPSPRRHASIPLSQHDAQDAYRCYRRPQAQHNARGRRRLMHHRLEPRQLERAQSPRAPPPRRAAASRLERRSLERAVAAVAATSTPLTTSCTETAACSAASPCTVALSAATSSAAATWQVVRCRCYESRRESKVTRRGYANSGRTRQWHHHRACGRVICACCCCCCCCLWHPSPGACTKHAPTAHDASCQEA